MSSKAAMDQLVSDAEELLAKLKDAGNPEIQRLRAKVESGIAEAKGAIAEAKGSATEQVQLSVERLRQLRIDISQKPLQILSNLSNEVRFSDIPFTLPHFSLIAR